MTVARPSPLVNSTVSGNYAADGGGIHNAGGPLALRNSTIAFNRAANGGGLYAGGFLSIRNTIIANNTDDGDNVPSSANCALFSTPLYTGVNIAGDNTCGTDPALLIADAKLGPLADNGGPTNTHALDATSPAIDLGGQCTETTDQRYVARNQGASCDVGAYEFDRFSRLTLTVGPNAAVTKSGVATVAGTITCTAPATVELDVALSQPQKSTGKFTTIVQASGQTTVACTGTSSWSVVLTAQSGAFSNGPATSTVETTNIPAGFLPASLTGPVKLFQVAK